jgi:hypothetical protein
MYPKIGRFVPKKVLMSPSKMGSEKTNFQASLTILTDGFPTQQGKAYNFGFEVY